VAAPLAPGETTPPAIHVVAADLRSPSEIVSDGGAAYLAAVGARTMKTPGPPVDAPDPTDPEPGDGADDGTPGGGGCAAAPGTDAGGAVAILVVWLALGWRRARRASALA